MRNKKGQQRTGERSSLQRRQFANHYLKTGDAAASAIAAGYSKKTARQIGCRLLTSVYVQRYMAGRFHKAEIQGERLISETAQQAFEELPDIGDLFDATGNFRPMHELTIEQRRCIAGVDVVKRNLTGGDGHTDTILKVKLWNIRAERIKALELLAKILKLVNNVPSDAPLVSIFQVNCLPALSPDPEIEKARAELTAGAIDV